jgi:hypothetical protein
VQVVARYGVVPRTVERWTEDPHLGFPAPLVIRKRRYWVLAELEAWERGQAAEAS